MNRKSVFRKLLTALWCRTLYRPVMRLAHRYHWHHAPPDYPDGDMVLRCSWCGFSSVVARRHAHAQQFVPHTFTRSTGRNPGDGQP